MTTVTTTRPAQLFPLTRHLSARLTPILLRTALTPNQVTVLSMLAGVAGGLCFAAARPAMDVAGALLLLASYVLDNCDGDIARARDLCSEWGAALDDVADWVVDGTFFAALGYGAWQGSGEVLWLWLGLAATAGATVDYVVDRVIERRQRGRPESTSRETQGREPKQPQDALDWVIYVFHKLSRADFPFIVLALALGGVAWVLLPLGAVGAQAYWVTDLFKRARGWHT